MLPTLHILSSPSNPVHINNRMDPFSIAVVKFVNNIQKFGWKCIHYGIPGCEVNCETVICLDTLDTDHQVNKARYNQNASLEIKKRKKPKDMILCFYGADNQGATTDNNELSIIEPYIAYDHTAVFAPYRIFVSYATMHMFYGHHKMLMNPSWFDAVITNGFTPDEFEFNENPQDYILYFGRVVEVKGIHIAIQATEKTGNRLIIAGPGSLENLGYNLIPKHVTCVGLCDAEQRKHLMKNAKAIIGPTYYVEPFGNMVVEGYFSGTPAITSDWGGFTETVVNGVTGYRCKEMKDFVYALQNIDKIDRKYCRKFAEERYDEKVVYHKFHEYFLKIKDQNFYRN